MQKNKKDLLTSIVMLIVSTIYYSQTFKIRQTTLISITSTFIPRLCSLAIVVLSLLMGFRSLKSIKSERNKNVEQKTDKKELIGALVAFVILFLGIFIMNIVGFIYGAFTYLILSFITLGANEEKKNWIIRIVLAIVSSLIIYAFFYYGFHLGLPSGFLGLFGGIL